MKVKRNTLLLLAAICWFIAGFNVTKIGIKAYSEILYLKYYFLSILIFILFQIFVFGGLVKKHSNRILSFTDERVFFLNFFDLKAYMVMAIMITMGIVIRANNLVPLSFIAFFYTGLGCSLLLSALLFLINFIRNKSVSDIV